MRVWRVVISLFFILLSACTSIRSNEEISLERVEGRKKLVVNYDRGRYNTVKLDNIVIDSGREYYVKEGESNGPGSGSSGAASGSKNLS